MKNIAHAKKNYVVIFVRYLRYSLYRVVSKLASAFFSNGSKNPVQQVYVYIKISDEITKNKIRDFKNLTKLRLATNNEGFAKELGLELAGNKFLKDPSTLILLNEFSLCWILLNLKYLSRTKLIDRHFWSSLESENWLRIFNDINLGNSADLVRINSENNFKKFLSLDFHKKEKSICFTTGPSFDLYRDFSFDGYLKIICNSSIKDIDFLEYIGGPDILVFADPVFHFGLNPYAKEFRSAVLQVMDKYPNCYIFTTEENVVALSYFMPELSARVIGLKVVPEYKIISEGCLSVYPTANILTLMMLPIASSFTKKIHILGADGRDPKEKYFWKHSSSAQFSGKMESAFLYHPSFFRDRIYSEYYAKHCAQLEKHIAFFEGHGREISSLTESHIPALVTRRLRN